ncbi:MAG: ABC transporter ATP-binding protein [Defluviitaleaceae bacterium]|nr:ABC transporter ATP-binding protein [Defluviitaleaceae bacterium]MCL2276146.1 ABC transporter ATP-binding protein [Defluviitaleaceae bacterium]
MSNDTLLQIKDLRVSFRIEGQYYAAVDGVNLEIKKDEVFALVGESGCGKSAMALSISRLHNENYTQCAGEVLYEGKDLLSMTPAEMNNVRGGKIGMIFQDPLTAMNPLMRIGAQIEETLTYHTNLSRAEKKARALELLERVGMVNPALTYDQFPHELSGGMRQRSVIAIAIAAKPDLIIADEPTTALDVTIQAQILDLLDELRTGTGGSMILITHDLAVVADIADRVAVMYAGQIVETATVYDLFANPLHPYTRSLLHSMPSALTEEARLHTIQGIVPTLKNLPRTGCRFAERIPWHNASLHEENPTYHEVTPGHFVLCTCYKTFALGGGTHGTA